ncbi:hypothetical protein FSW04_06705 [Baekduia soli]|uniref:Uncharacterized protein n=1 Tax=Baekduia soli TaxID=496014 RepID=A0A5B8U2Q0_9ACTN|nr:hypothetical protein [Baekduia soli]QEC47307.1 hypothetical protein FSW04_06705 [Baekduia soli]
MAHPPDDRCESRQRRRPIDHDHPGPVADDEVGLSPLGRAFLDALRDDDRFRDIIADPFGERAALDSDAA